MRHIVKLRHWLLPDITVMGVKKEKHMYVCVLRSEWSHPAERSRFTAASLLEATAQCFSWKNPSQEDVTVPMFTVCFLFIEVTNNSPPREKDSAAAGESSLILRSLVQLQFEPVHPDFCFFPPPQTSNWTNDLDENKQDYLAWYQQDICRTRSVQRKKTLLTLFSVAATDVWNKENLITHMDSFQARGDISEEAIIIISEAPIDFKLTFRG